jgi:multidrug efflux system membrane fusion protein
LWPGQFVRVTLQIDSQPNAVVVPNQAVQTGQEGTFVYVVKQDRTVENRPVVTGSRVEEETVIAKGLEEGETVVTEGQLRLVPGSHVTVRDASGQPLGRGGRGGEAGRGAGKAPEGRGGQAPEGRGGPGGRKGGDAAKSRP